MKRILIVMQDNCTNTIGGSITITSELANILYRNNYNVITCAFSPKSNNHPKNLDERIPFFDIKQNYVDFNSFVEEMSPNLIIYTIPMLLIKLNLYSEKTRNIPKIIMFHSRPDYYFNYDTDEWLLKKHYINTSSQILFPSYYDLLPRFIKNGNVFHIPNYSSEITTTINCGVEHKKIVYLSRMAKLKGQEYLLRAFSRIAHKYPQWSLDIWGQAEPEDYKDTLIKLAKSLKIFNQVNFCGVTEKPIEILSNYDFCVFTSLFEGFPVGLIEAQSVGLPAIGFKYCTGVNELIIDNENGFLVDDIKELAMKMEILINNPELRNKFSKNTLQFVKQYYKSNFENLWLKNIDIILNNKEKSNFECKTFKHTPLSIKKIINLKYQYNIKLIERIFSLKNSPNGIYKIITILGIKVAIRRRNGY